MQKSFREEDHGVYVSLGFEFRVLVALCWVITAAVAWEPHKLSIEDVEVAPPKARRDSLSLHSWLTH
jgi:hypothetical protein